MYNDYNATDDYDDYDDYDDCSTQSYCMSDEVEVIDFNNQIINPEHPFLGLEEDSFYNEKLLVCLGRAFSIKYKIFGKLMQGLLYHHSNIYIELGRIFIRWLRKEDLQLDHQMIDMLIKIHISSVGLDECEKRPTFFKNIVASNKPDILNSFQEFFFNNPNPPTIYENVTKNLHIYSIFESALEFYNNIDLKPEEVRPWGIDTINQFNIENKNLNQDTSNDMELNSYNLNISK